MLTEQQKAAAERALRKVKLSDLRKQVALRRRNRCLKDVAFYGLPFRVLYDLNQPPEQIPINHFYPYRARSSGMELQIEEARQQNGGHLTAEAIEGIESAEHTPEALREYYFTCFLSGVDFGTFRGWDWTGEPIPEDAATTLKEEYTARQQDFLKNPDKYAAPALKKDDDMGRYSSKQQELMKLYDEVMNK